MRLRSSQIVMLLLLACSVQVGEAYARHLMAGQTLCAVPLADALTAPSSHTHPASPGVDRSSFALCLSQSAIAFERTPWSMRHPASASAAVASFTGLLRA